MPDTTASAELWITAISEGLGEDVGGGDRQDASRDGACSRPCRTTPAPCGRRGSPAAPAGSLPPATLDFGPVAVDNPQPERQEVVGHAVQAAPRTLRRLADRQDPLHQPQLLEPLQRAVWLGRDGVLDLVVLVRPVAIALRTVPGRSPASVSVARIKRPSLSNGAPGSSGLTLTSSGNSSSTANNGSSRAIVARDSSTSSQSWTGRASRSRRPAPATGTAARERTASSSCNSPLM